MRLSIKQLFRVASDTLKIFSFYIIQLKLKIKNNYLKHRQPMNLSGKIAISARLSLKWMVFKFSL